MTDTTTAACSCDNCEGIDPATRLANPNQPRDTTDADLAGMKQRARRFYLAWKSAHSRAGVLSRELTRRAPLTGQYAAALVRVQALHERMEGYGDSDYCNVCSNHGDIQWPCATIRAIEEA